MSQQIGGVGYNLAVAAARSAAYRPVSATFITAVGDDGHASRIVNSVGDCMTVESVELAGCRTGQYTCIVRPDGEIDLAIQDMKIAQKFTPELVEPKLSKSNPEAVLVDFNLSELSLEFITSKMNKSKSDIFIEPTSLFKISERAYLLRYAEAAFPNLEELLTFHSCLVTISGSSINAAGYDSISLEALELRKNVDRLETEIMKICSDIFNTGNGPNYFIVTVAELGAFFGEFKKKH